MHTTGCTHKGLSFHNIERHGLFAPAYSAGIKFFFVILSYCLIQDSFCFLCRTDEFSSIESIPLRISYIRSTFIEFIVRPFCTYTVLILKGYSHQWLIPFDKHFGRSLDFVCRFEHTVFIFGVKPLIPGAFANNFSHSRCKFFFIFIGIFINEFLQCKLNIRFHFVY